MKMLARIFAFLCGLYVSAAMAAYQPGAIVQLPTVAALQGGNYSNTPYINIANYATLGDGGGGTFVPCGTGPCTVDNGVVFQDAAGNKFIRQFTGAVQLPWYGVQDATTSPCLTSMAACDAYPAYVAAKAAAEAYGNFVVSTAGRTVVFYSGAPSLTQNDVLDCGAYQGGAYKQTTTPPSKIYALPNSIVLNPAFTIALGDNTELTRCIIRPTWYVPGTFSWGTIPAASARDLVGIKRQFSGTAISCAGEACNPHDLSVIGFDVNVQVLGPRAKLNHIISENNIEAWVSTQRGGMEISGLDNPTTYFSNNYAFKNTDYPVTNSVNSGGAIKLTLDPTNVLGGMQLVAGDTVLVGGMQYASAGALTGTAFGDVCSVPSGSCTPNVIQNVSVLGAAARTPFPGMLVTDTSGCIPVNSTVTAWDPDSDDDPNSGTMTISNNATCTKKMDRLSLTDTSTAPPGALGVHIVGSVSGNDITLLGPLWTGPTKTGSSWSAGYSVITTTDSTDIAPFGQYLCNSGTAPFGCTLPTGWAQGSATGTTLSALGTNSNTNLTISGSLTGWPAQGIIKVDSEVMSYSIVNSTTLLIGVRGLQCTTNTTHSNGTTLSPAAPLVTFIDSQDNKIVLNVAAQSSSTGTTKFANDPTICGATVGDVLLAPEYATYSATAGVGQNLGTGLHSVASGTSGAQTITLGGDAYWPYVYEGESVADLTSGHSAFIPAGTYVDQTPTSVAIHLCVGGSPCSGTLPSNISGDLISFGGGGSCGYPGLITGTNKQPWLGNCAPAMAVFGQLGGKSVQGIRCFSNHNANHRNGLRLINAPATSCTMNVLNSSGKADGYDYNKSAIWISGTTFGQAQKTNLCNNRTSLILIDNTVGNTNDIALCATQIAGSVIVAGGLIDLSQIHPSGSDQDFPAILVENGLNLVTGVSIAGTQLPGYLLVTDGAAADAQIHCSTDTVITSALCSLTAQQTFTPTGATTSTTLSNFATRALSIRDFGGVPDWTTDSTAALTAAETAAVAQGVHTILLDGDSRGSGYVFSNHSVANNIQLVCPGSFTGPPASNDFRNYPQSILLAQTGGLVFTTGSGMHGCNVLQKALAQSTPPATFQDNYTRSTSFTGTAITITGANVVIDTGSIVGFNIGLLTKASRQATFHDLNLDALSCYEIFNQGGGGAHQGYNLQCSPYATRFGPLAEPSFAVSSITDNGSGVLQAHLTSTCTGTGCPLNGYNVWLAGGGNASVQSAQGGWTAANVTSSTVDLQGSSSAFLTGQTESATTTTGSVIVSGITTGIAQVEPTQSITGACLPAGAKIAAVQRTYGIIWLDSAHPASSTGACTVTITDSAPAAVSVSSLAIGSSGGTGYGAGDLVTVSGGTGTAATINIDAVDVNGVVTALSLNDGGSYTVSPGTTNVATTGGAGTGLTVNLSLGASLYGSAVVRSGPAYSFAKVTDVRLTNIGDLSHAVGMAFGNGAHAINVRNCSLHDENVLQDQTHIGISFTSVSNNNKVSACDSFYFGAAVYSHNLGGSNLGANVVSDSALGGSAGNSGLQNTILDMASPTPGTASKTSLTLTGNLSTVAGTFLVMQDERSLNMSNNSFPNSNIFYQNAATLAAVGAGNTMSSTSGPVYSVSSSGTIVPGALNESGGQQNLANSSTTFTPFVNGSTVFDTGALTNNRNLTLSNTGATAGFGVTVIRTGSSGGFVRNVFQADGTTLITAMADGTSATFKFNSATSLWVKQ